MKFAKLLCSTGFAVLLSGTVAAQETGTLTGKVTDADRSPLPRVQLRLTGTTLEVETQPDGTFTLPGIAPGRHTVELRLLGYAARAEIVDVSAGSTLNVSFSLTRAAVELDTVSVTARLNPHLEGFEQRRARGVGRFFTRSELTRTNARGITDVLRRVPGFMLQGSTHNDGAMVESGRTSRTGNCPVLYYLNGSPLPVAAGGSINSFVQLDAVEGIEVYSGASQIPPQFNSQGFRALCGVVVVWTRMGSVKETNR